MRRAIVGLLLLLTACGGSGAGPSQTDELDLGGTWRLTSGTASGDEIPILDDHPITLTITGSEVNGVAACNQYGGRISLKGGGISIDELFMTAAACEAPVGASEAAYVDAFQRVSGMAREGDELVLSGTGIDLIFTRLPEPPTAELTDATWILDTLFVGDVASPVDGEPAALEFRSDGTFAGSTGCRSFSGRWIERGGQIVATEMAMDDRICPAGLSDQDGHVVGVIGDGFVPTIAADLLTLTDPGSIGLVYRLDD